MMRSESTSAFGHPRLTNPTFGWRRLMRGRDCTDENKPFQGFARPRQRMPIDLNPAAQNPVFVGPALTSITAAQSRRAEGSMVHTLEQRPVGALGRMTVVAGIHLAVFYFIARGLGVVPQLGPVETEPVSPIDTPPPIEHVPTPPVIIEHATPYVPEPVAPIDTP